MDTTTTYAQPQRKAWVAPCIEDALVNDTAAKSTNTAETTFAKIGS